MDKQIICLAIVSRETIAYLQLDFPFMIKHFNKEYLYECAYAMNNYYISVIIFYHN